MFKKVIGKRCKVVNYPSCAAVVAVSREACESCDGPLEVVEATDKRRLIATGLAISLALLGVGLAGLKVTVWLSNAAPAKTVERRLSPSDEASLVKLLRSIYADGLKTPQEQGKLDEAAQRLAVRSSWLSQKEEEIKANADDMLVGLKKGLSYAAHEDYRQAEREFRRCVELNPENAYAWADLAAANLKTGQLEQAMYACDQATALDPHNWLAHYNLGSLYAVKADNDGALRELSEAVRLATEGTVPQITRAEMADHIRRDRSFDALQKDRRFQQLFAHK